MAAPPFPNRWYHRKVADASAKACWICYKPSVNVLITPDNKDFFYVCLGHLQDRAFATPDAEEAAAAEERRRKAELEREIEAVKKEFAEKLRKKAEKKVQKEGKGDGKEDGKKDEAESKEGGKKDGESAEDVERERDEKLKALEKGKETQTSIDGPRIFSLQRNFYQQRLDRIRGAEIARRNRERLQNPATFPSAPKGDLQ